MATRYLYLVRHGEADAFGDLTAVGREQARLLGRRLAHLPLDHVWHSPLPRAADTARELDLVLSGAAPVAEADVLVGHVPYVPRPGEAPPSWSRFFDGYDQREAAAGYACAQRLTARFARPPDGDDDLHELLVTHTYPIAWLVRDALDAPAQRWLTLTAARNTALTVIEHRSGTFPTVRMLNDASHLSPGLPQ